MKNITEQNQIDLAYEPVPLTYESELQMVRLLIETMKQMAEHPMKIDLPVIA